MSPHAIDVTGSPADVAAMIVSVFGRAMVDSREAPTAESRIVAVQAALDALQLDVQRAIAHRATALGRCVADREHDNALIERLRANVRDLSNPTL